MRAWAEREAARRPELVRLGYFGSYARGDWGVGSDLDLVAMVEGSDTPFTRRGLDWPTEDLPVGADLLVYTEEEWARMLREGARLARTIEAEAVWVFSRNLPP